MNNRLFIPFILVLVSLAWAGSFIVVSIATQDMDPVDLGFLRFLIATPIMLFFIVINKKDISVPKKELPSIAILGLTGVTFLYLFQFVGIKLTNASTASILININVIFIAIFSAIILKETFQKKKIIGIFLSFIGVIIIIFSNESLEFFSNGNMFYIGCLFILLSALCWAIYSIIGKRLIQTYDIFLITTYAFVFGIIFYMPFIISDIIPAIKKVSINGWLAVLYLSLVCTIFAYIGWYYALKRIEAGKAAVYLNLIPFFTIIMSIFIGESITIFFIFGAILIIYGVYLTQRS